MWAIFPLIQANLPENGSQLSIFYKYAQQVWYSAWGQIMEGPKGRKSERKDNFMGYFIGLLLRTTPELIWLPNSGEK